MLLDILSEKVNLCLRSLIEGLDMVCEFQLSAVIHLLLPVNGIQEIDNTANNIIPLDSNLVIQCQLLIKGGMRTQLYLVKKRIGLKFSQILSGIPVDKGTGTLQHLLLQITAKGILSLFKRAIGKGKGLWLQFIYDKQNYTDMSAGNLMILAIRALTGKIRQYALRIQNDGAAILITVNSHNSIYII